MAPPPARRRRPPPACLAAAGALVAASAPHAAAQVLRVEVPAPVAEVPGVVRVVVPVAGEGTLEVRYRPLPGRPCAATPARDGGRGIHRPWPLEGPVTAERTWAFPAPGPVRVCAWFRRARGPALRGAARVRVAPADGALLLTAPTAARPGRPVRLVVAGEAPAARRVYMRVRPDGAVGCGPSYVATAGRGLLQDAPVVGGFRRVVRWTPARGRWLVCAWLGRAGDDTTGTRARAAVAAGVPPRRAATTVRLDIADGGPPYIVTANLASPAGVPRGRCVADVRIPAGWEGAATAAVGDDGRCTVRVPAARDGGAVVRVRYLPSGTRWRAVIATVAIPPP
jgi:hypothetical protein